MLRLPEILERTGLSRSQIYEMIAAGDFPPLIKLGRRAAALPEAWLNCFVEEKARRALERTN
ncbi:hypothetical protein XM53_16385 [Roseovarius atlanticus]|uniref:DNA-binding protein n=1 Tax=Roseovarius atlanticus TaxID=1641875 RepID=A0A0T5NRJ0_9RHOB|nr:hypothetical protein XM53_16385 [Roseovarius atlanticus]